jgi:FtsZ-binding cell division protein ZapB
MNTRSKEYSDTLHERFVRELAGGAVSACSEGEGCTDDEIRRELVTWASRLEFESMDLREKSKVLSLQLLKNSDQLGTTTAVMKEEFQTWQEKTAEPINELCSSLRKANDSIKSTNMLLGKQRKQLESDLIGEGYSEMVQMLRSISGQLDQLQNQRGNARTMDNNARPIDQILSNLQDFIGKQIQSSIYPQTCRLNNTMELMLEKFNKFERSNSALNNMMKKLEHSQNSLSTELQSLKDEIKKWSTDVRYPLTPNSSSITLPNTGNSPEKRPTRRYSERIRRATLKFPPLESGLSVQSKPIPARVKRASYQRNILEPPEPSLLSQDGFECINLLSDDLISDL